MNNVAVDVAQQERNNNKYYTSVFSNIQILTCDASHYVVGAVLGQREDKKPHVIYHASRTLNNDQINYSTTEKRTFSCSICP